VPSWLYNRDVTEANFDLAIVGCLTVDTFVTLHDRVFSGLLGGSAAYAAAGARVWSESVGIIGRIDSEFPAAHLQALQLHGVDVSSIRRLPEPMDTATFFTYEGPSTRTSGNPASTFLRLGEPLPKTLIGFHGPSKLDPESGFPAWAPHSDDVPAGMRSLRGAFLASSPYPSQSTLVERLQDLHVPKMGLDPETAIMQRRKPELISNLVNGVGVFMPSETQTRALLGPSARDIWQLAERLAELGSQHVVIKRGPRGQCLLDGQTGKRWLIPAYPARVEDVTGAGHAYGGGFLAGWVQTDDLVEAALAGAISASLAIEGSGPLHLMSAMPGLAKARRDSLRRMVHRV
jgi:sugar/nucleoside kinase (ribokinase family)